MRNEGLRVAVWLQVMEKDTENKRLKLENEIKDVAGCSGGDPDSNDSISREPSAFYNEPDDKFESTEKDLGEDRKNSFEVAEKYDSYLDTCLADTDDEDDNLDTEEEDDDIEEKKTNLEFLTTEDEFMDTFLADDSKKDKHELEDEDAVVAEREPIIFGALSEFLPVCVVTLDIGIGGNRNPCYDLRERLKLRLWSQSSEILDHLIILYNLFKTNDTCLQLIDCEGPVQFYVQVFALNAIKKFASEVQSGRYTDILACMLLSCTIREKMKKLNAQIYVTCQCESLDRWKTEYEQSLCSFRFYQPITSPQVTRTTTFTDWPSSSSFNPVRSEKTKVSMATVLDQQISEDSAWAAESINIGQRNTCHGKPAIVSQHTGGSEQGAACSVAATLLTTEDKTLLSSSSLNEVASREPLLARSRSVDELSSKCGSSSSTFTNNKVERRQSF